MWAWSIDAKREGQNRSAQQQYPGLDDEDWFDPDDYANEVQPSERELLETPNNDRLSCLRQDDLDLAVPHTDEQVVRMVIGVGNQNTQNDIYLSVTDVWIKELTAVVKLKRQGLNQFAFEITGDDMLQDTKVASVDFRIKGVDVMMNSGWMDWGASLAADRNLLATGQDGSLKFNIKGRGRAEWNSTSLDWDLKMVEQEAKPFEFKISNQWILEKALNNYGGIDKLIMDALWPAVLGALPKSMLTSYNYLTPDELWTDVNVLVTGGMPDEDSDLSARLDVKISFETDPGKLLQVLHKNFDAASIAQRKMSHLLDSWDLEELWETNKDQLATVLARYGMKPEFLDQPFNKTALDEYFLTRAKEQGDFAMLVWQPFIEARQAGKDNLFDGLLVQHTLQGSWGTDGLIKASFTGPEAPNQKGYDDMVRLPRAFLETFNTRGMFGTPRPGKTSFVRHEALTLSSNELRLGKCTLSDLRLRQRNEDGTKKKTWKLKGTVHDVLVKLPRAWDMGFEAEWKESTVTLLDNHEWVVRNGPEGFKLKQVPLDDEILALRDKEKKAVVHSSRKGDSDTLIGVVPEELSRPTQKQVAISRTALVTSLSSKATLTIEGEHSKLAVALDAGATATLNLRQVLTKVLAPRPTQDFGYTFFVGRFTRKVVNGEEAVPRHSTVAAVVSCGYLRLLKPGWKPKHGEPPLKRLDMVPEDGQLQIDLTKYDAAPIMEESREGACMVLYSSGQPQRKGAYGGIGLTGRWYKDCEERLCGPKEEVKKLVDAIGLQVRRFNHNPELSVRWRYGTHNATMDNDQYPLPDGTEAVSLTSLIDY